MNPTIKSFNVYEQTENFEESKAFYRELGFELTEAWGGTARFWILDCGFGIGRENHSVNEALPPPHSYVREGSFVSAPTLNESITRLISGSTSGRL
jgi:catechol 2,3-dioxygenase-like lactoylglutathione lyase family enzyme